MIVSANFTSEDVPPEADRPGQVGKRPNIAVMEQW